MQKSQQLLLVQQYSSINTVEYKQPLVAIILRTVITILIFVLLSGSLSAQPSDIDTLYKNVNKAQKERLENKFSESRDSIFTKFDAAIKDLFNHQEICNEFPDRANNYFLINGLSNEKQGKTLAYAFMNNIVISSSDDAMLKIYSWDNLGGGTQHSYTNYILFKDKNESCKVLPFDTSENSDEVGYYYIKKLNHPKKNLYLVFGYGTYGGGKQHYVVRILELNESGLAECLECYPEQKILKIGSNRSQNIDLNFDTHKQSVSFKQFRFDDEVGFFSKDYEHVLLKIINGKLIKE